MLTSQAQNKGKVCGMSLSENFPVSVHPVDQLRGGEPATCSSSLRWYLYTEIENIVSLRDDFY